MVSRSMSNGINDARWFREIAISGAGALLAPGLVVLEG